jgi:hypothetical protein
MDGYMRAGCWVQEYMDACYSEFVSTWIHVCKRACMHGYINTYIDARLQEGMASRVHSGGNALAYGCMAAWCMDACMLGYMETRMHERKGIGSMGA